MIDITDKIIIEEDVALFIEDVYKNTTGYNIYLGGGYHRDKYTGNTPKDVDVFVIPNGQEKDLYIPPRGYNNYIKNARDISDMQKRGVHKVRGDWYSKMSTSDVQFIIYEKPMTMEELAEDMDINICQVMYSAATLKVSATKAFVDGHKNEVIECLHDYDRVRTFKRYVRMEDKFFTYSTKGKPDLDCYELSELAQHMNHDGSFCEETLESEVQLQEGSEKW